MKALPSGMGFFLYIQAGFPQEVPKPKIKGSFTDGKLLAPGCREQTAFRFCFDPHSNAVSFQHLCQCPVHWNNTLFVVLGMADQDGPIAEIYIFYPGGKRFSQAEPAPKEHPEQHTELHVRPAGFRVCMPVGPAVGAGQKRLDFPVRKNIWDIAV